LSTSGRYAIVGVGETAYRRFAPDPSPTTLELATEAVNAALADAGLAPSEVNGMMSYSIGDSVESSIVAGNLGITLDNFTDILGGGSSIETLIMLAIGTIEAGAAHTICIFRSMLGYSGNRIGLAKVGGPQIGNGLTQAYGLVSPAQRFSPVFARYMSESGTTSEQVAHVKATHSRHASANPKALYPDPVTVEEVLDSRWIVRPTLHLLDCCVESDSATALVVTSLERARDLRHRPIRILGAVGRFTRQYPEYLYWGDMTDLGMTRAAEAVFSLAGVTHDDIDLTGAYDAFTFTSTLVLEKAGFCAPGEGGEYVSSGAISLGGMRPNNTSGGQLCEGYTHGVNLVIENVRQLRGTVDDYCPGCLEGEHSYDYRAGGCRQVKDARISMNLGWRAPTSQSALILARD
jgi:acetyl-CoA acetyltransferase